MAKFFKRLLLCLIFFINALSLRAWSVAISHNGISRALGSDLVLWSSRFLPFKSERSEKARTHRKLLRVVTDIDDTVKSSGNKRFAGIPLGGIDSQYERGQFYPGVFQFALELAANNTPVGCSPLPVAVLTARAKELLFALELKEKHPVNIKFSGWGLGPVLYGSVKEWICWTRKSRRKFKNFKRLMEQDLKELQSTGYGTDYVFIGDTGEGDPKAGVEMCKNFPGDVRAMFLHSVSCDEEYCKVPDDYYVNGVPVFFFRTYVGAAAKAYEAGLLTVGAVQRVIQRAVYELETSGAERDSSKWEDLEMDIEMFEQKLSKGSESVLSLMWKPSKLFEANY